MLNPSFSWSNPIQRHHFQLATRTCSDLPDLPAPPAQHLELTLVPLPTNSEWAMAPTLAAGAEVFTVGPGTKKKRRWDHGKTMGKSWAKLRTCWESSGKWYDILWDIKYDSSAKWNEMLWQTMFIMGYNVMFKQVVMWVPVKTGYQKWDDLLLTKTESTRIKLPCT